MKKVISSNVGKRIDAMLREQQADVSRAWIQKAIESGKITVNGKTVRSSYRLKVDDVIEGEIPQKEKPHKTATNVLVDVLHEDDGMAFINKPAGLLVHSAPHTSEPTLVDGLLKKYPSLLGVGEDRSRPGIVHRLDKETSGVMIVAKNQEVYEVLKNAWLTKAVEKIYLAVVHGHIDPSADIIEGSIRHAAAHHRMATDAEGQGKNAITVYETLAVTPAYSLLKVMPKTGRTHQIRVHLASRGYPIVGDHLYKFRRLKTRSWPRMMLHAWKLSLHLPEKTLQAKATPPEDFLEVLKDMKFDISRLDLD